MLSAAAVAALEHECLPDTTPWNHTDCDICNPFVPPMALDLLPYWDPNPNRSKKRKPTPIRDFLIAQVDEADRYPSIATSAHPRCVVCKAPTLRRWSVCGPCEDRYPSSQQTSFYSHQSGLIDMPPPKPAPRDPEGDDFDDRPTAWL